MTMIYSIIIARSNKDKNSVSCASQVSEIQEEAIKQNEHVIKVLEFPETNHIEFFNALEFQDILAEVKAKDRKWTKMWFYDTARVSRSRIKAQAIKSFLRNHDITVEFLKLPKTGIDAIDNLMEGMLEAFDQLHLDFSKIGADRNKISEAAKLE